MILSRSDEPERPPWTNITWQIAIAPGRPAGASWRTRAWASSAWRSGRCSTATGSFAPIRFTAGVLPDGQPHFPPRAKRVIWLMMRGGVSHLESFDPKPELTKHAGKTINESRHKATVFDSPYLKNVREQVANNIIDKTKGKIYPTQIGFQKGGQSGIDVSDWWPHVRECVDDLAVIRSMYTTDNNHGAQMEFFTGRHLLDGCFPTIGAWVHYGLGALSDDLPQFISMGPPLEYQCMGATDANYLGPENSGVILKVDPSDPLPFARPGVPVGPSEGAIKAELLGRLNRLVIDRVSHRRQAPRPDQVVRAGLSHADGRSRGASLRGRERIHADGSTVSTTMSPARSASRCSRPAASPSAGFASSRSSTAMAPREPGTPTRPSAPTTRALCAQVDKPIAGLLTDLKRRGLLDDTVVVWATEFGRTPCAQGADGRDHHNYGFSVWMAGGGIKGGIVHGATDELGFHAVENRHYVTDIHATVLQLLGLDSHRLEIPGRKRLELEHGKPIREILA